MISAKASIKPVKAPILATRKFDGEAAPSSALLTAVGCLSARSGLGYGREVIRIRLCMERGALGRDCTAPPADRATSRRIADRARLETLENRRMQRRVRLRIAYFLLLSKPEDETALTLVMLHTGWAWGQLQKSLIDEERRRQRCDFVEHPAQGNIRQGATRIAAADWARSGARKLGRRADTALEGVMRDGVMTIASFATLEFPRQNYA